LPLSDYIFFALEVLGCSLYLIFLVALARNKYSLNTPFFKLFISTGLAGVGTISTYWLLQYANYPPARQDDAYIIKAEKVLNGASLFSYTCGKFLIVINRFDILTNMRNSV
ncbi:hypothetical protein PMAYCL1PPCAC_04809, partial [Pristionchus mayeri]